MKRPDEILPQLGSRVFLSDSGIETTLIFDEGRALPSFAAFPLLDEVEGRDWLERYYGRHLGLAEERGFGFVLDTPTWRASPDWGRDLGYDAAGLRRVNRASVEFCRKIRQDWIGRIDQIVISGVLGPRGDAYQSSSLSADAAQDYHAAQIGDLADAGADMISAFTLTTVEEAVGIARAAQAAGIPSAISFTLETDGRLPSGVGLGEAIREVDLQTGEAPAYFMINCAHPTHFADLFAGRPDWAGRIRGLKANASTKSHAELDASDTLDAGDPQDLAARYADLRALMPGLSVLGGCCGTDHRHIAAIARSCNVDAAI